MQVTRQQLYDQVWSKPIRKLAKEYNLSDVGLSKLCRRHNIPLPPMGHWMKVSHGKIPQRIPLPPSQHGESEIVEIVIKQPGTLDNEKYPELFKQYSEIKRDGLAPEFPSSTNRLHPLLLSTQECLKKAKPDNEGRISAAGEGCANVRVSPGTLDRALKIMHALFRLFESQGFDISLDDLDNSGTRVTILGEVIRISLLEHVKRGEKVKPGSFGNKYQFHPSGVLSLGLDRYGRRWSDSDSGKLEDKLLKINEGLIDIALHQRIWDLNWEEVQRKKAEEQERLKVDEQKRKDEETRFKKLIGDAKDWQTSQLLRAYIDAVRKQSLSGDNEMQQWLLWAESKVDELDPMLHGRRQ